VHETEGGRVTERTPTGRQHPFHLAFRQRNVLRDEVGAAVDIAAPRQHVWEVLTDLASYPRWNTFTREARGALGVGEKVELHVFMPGKRPQWRTEWINLVEPETSTLCWGMTMGHPMLLVANRYQVLTDLDDGGTRYATVDQFSGLLTPLVIALYGEAMRLGFEATGASLKRVCEAGVSP
jgi:uncharacterized protein YndB with AHSA1/START domain